jgi:hypothetical protein
LGKAAPDWDPRLVKLFLKSQHVKKLPKAHASASKGQIVTDIAHGSLFPNAVWALYVERQLLVHKKKHVYLHARANVHQMNTWYQAHWDRSQGTTACDMTGWDTGVDEAFSLFYRNVFKSYGVPDEVAERFVEERHSRFSHKGPMSAMQASGDRYTWLCNTIGNMGVTGVQFPDYKNEAACFSGDDMLINATLRFKFFRIPFNFIPKVVYGAVNEFCGFLYGRQRLVVSSEALLHRCHIALENGEVSADYWLSMRQAAQYASSNNVEELDPFYASLVSFIRSVEHRFALKVSARWKLPGDAFSAFTAYRRT